MVFDIQRYSLHDGPGIRTVVFFKGCPLRCLWCANPESFISKPSLYYIKSRCVRCGRCVEAAPQGALRKDKDGSLEIDFEVANSHNLSWISCCVAGAIGVKGQKIDSDELCKLLLRDEIFYRKSYGGITLSGGEPLMQGEFAQSILKKMHDKYNIHTAVETTGAIAWDILDKISPYVSLFLYDLKIVDTNLHKKYTGIGNERILENLSHLSRIHENIEVRTPVIPDINDSEKAISGIAKVLVSMGIRKYSLLPFHQLGKGKYDSLGYKYTLKELLSPPEEKMEQLRLIVRSFGLEENYEKIHV